MKAILAVNNLGFIGLKSGLPWHCKADFKFFKEKTAGGTLLVGYNTFQTLPPLKGRVIVLDSGDYHPWTYGYWADVNGPQELNNIDWCIGGKATYEKYASLFTEIHISHINDNTIGDTCFPNLINLKPDCKIFNYYFEVDFVNTGMERMQEIINNQDIMDKDKINSGDTQT